ncbi:predicted protein [Sclerotinia sclerotiorum 1980 UF-70]|uniref:Uncharacterized protein n=1 Tax=Sclerotinia sclerotiorum (strain ATCC 18683 / 1980 / Ss-1) TaxID=665079 RepID=A7F636_SCLS1|nr:predicted protein [Sclerotinia sclerotiorum 1980 UF-70]EDN98207.1 predicted protein [Sclerotinia sclerotiorum 1980 UF-70]
MTGVKGMSRISNNCSMDVWIGRYALLNRELPGKKEKNKHVIVVVSLFGYEL